MHTQTEVAVGTNIWLKAPGLTLTPICARVVWAEGLLMGCTFVTPLLQATVEKALATTSVV